MKIKLVLIILLAVVFAFGCTAQEEASDIMVDDGDYVDDVMEESEEFDDGLDEALEELDLVGG